MTTWFMILGCWAVSFLFSGIEAGLLSADPVRLRNQVKQRQRAALLDEESSILSRVLMGIGIATLTTVVVVVVHKSRIALRRVSELSD